MVSFKAMISFSDCVTEWLPLHDMVRLIPDDELYNDMPQFMWMEGFGEDEIFLTMQIITAFRLQHKLPVID
jgi:hypothetical protein